MFCCQDSECTGCYKFVPLLRLISQRRKGPLSNDNGEPSLKIDDVFTGA